MPSIFEEELQRYEKESRNNIKLIQQMKLWIEQQNEKIEESSKLDARWQDRLADFQKRIDELEDNLEQYEQQKEQ